MTEFLANLGSHFCEMHMATLKQIAANRRNALKSTGPTSQEGKKQSRRNALKHGLAGSGLVLPHEDSMAVEQRIAEWHSSLKPFDNYETWLLEVIVVESIRIDRCRILDRVLRTEQVRRSGENWDDDQRQSAEEWAAKLAKNPTVVAKLRSTSAGASILLERWQGLARALENGGWSEPQEALVHDLLGIPEALREGVASPLNPCLDGDPLAHRQEIVRGQIERLERLIGEILPARNAEKRGLLQAGVTDLEDRALMRLHRYESRCFRRLTWATSQMRSKNKGVTLLSETPREIPVPRHRAEPPIYRPPSLRDSLAEKAAEVVSEMIGEVEIAKRTCVAESASKRVLKDLPSPKDRPSGRTVKARKAKAPG
jgi:hypothetical protein